MSWQATAWAAKQLTGSASNKLTLLALANYADADGVCWPTQETLAIDTEQSVDTVQRRVKALIALGLVRVEKRAAKGGKWAGRVYFLNMGVAEISKPQNAARSKSVDHAAPSPSTIPQGARRPYRTAVRHEPPIEQPIEPSGQKQATSRVASPKASQRKREAPEVVQNQIAQRLGSDGWEVLQQIDPHRLSELVAKQRSGILDDQTLARVRFEIIHPPRSRAMLTGGP